MQFWYLVQKKPPGVIIQPKNGGISTVVLRIPERLRWISPCSLFRVRLSLYEPPPLTKHANRVGVGALSGGIAAYISCPMEVAVVRLSNDSALPENERRNYKGITDTFTRIIKEEGVGAFWRGSNPFVARAMFVGVFQVATLDQFKDLYAS